jgi:hypothetical protein
VVCVHDDQLGHAAHSAADKSMWIILRPSASAVITHPRMLWRPRGQVIVFFSQSVLESVGHAEKVSQLTAGGA